MVSRMEQKKVPHDPLTSMAPSGGQAGQCFGPVSEHLRAHLISVRMLTVDKVIPVAQHFRLMRIDASQGSFEIDESLQ